MPALTLTSIQAPQPTTSRAQSTKLAFSPLTSRIAYCQGKSVFLRSLKNTSTTLGSGPSAVKIPAVTQFTEHNSNTTAVAFAPSVYYVASGDAAGHVKVWSAVGEPLLKSTFQVLSGKINAISWDSESKRLLVVGDGREQFGVTISWDSGNSVGEISGHSAQINAVSVTDSRPFKAVTVSDDGALVLLKGVPFKFEKSVRGVHSGFVKDVAFAPGAKSIVSVGMDRQIVLYDNNGEVIKKVNGHDGGILAVQWIDSTQFVTASADCSVKLWNLDLEVVRQWNFEKKVQNQQLGLIVGGDDVISISLSGELNILSQTSETPIKTIAGHQASITTGVLSQGILFTGSSDGAIVRWADGVAEKLQGHENKIIGLVESNGVVISAGWDDKLTFSNDQSFSLPEQPVAIDSTDSQVVVVSETHLLSFSNTGESQFDIKLTSTPTSVAISKRYIAVSFANNTVVLYSPVNGEQVSATPASRSTPCLVSLSPYTPHLAVGDTSGKIALYSIADDNSTALVTSRWAFHTSRVTSIDWNQDGDRVATASLDTGIVVYSVEKPVKNIKVKGAHKEGVTFVKWDGEGLVSGGWDGCVKKWVLES